MLSDEAAVREIRDIFRLFDKDKNDMINVSELGKMWRAIGQNPTESEIQEMMARVDKDTNGNLSWDEFYLLLGQNIRKSQEQEKNALLAAFKVFDTDNDGFITKAELSEAMATYGDRLCDQELEEVGVSLHFIFNFVVLFCFQMIKLVDENNDGKLSYSEFIQLFTAEESII